MKGDIRNLNQCMQELSKSYLKVEAVFVTQEELYKKTILVMEKMENLGNNFGNKLDNLNTEFHKEKLESIKDREELQRRVDRHTTYFQIFAAVITIVLIPLLLIIVNYMLLK